MSRIFKTIGWTIAGLLAIANVYGAAAVLAVSLVIAHLVECGK